MHTPVQEWHLDKKRGQENKGTRAEKKRVSKKEGRPDGEPSHQKMGARQWKEGFSKKMRRGGRKKDRQKAQESGKEKREGPTGTNYSKKKKPWEGSEVKKRDGRGVEKKDLLPSPPILDRQPQGKGDLNEGQKKQIRDEGGDVASNWRYEEREEKQERRKKVIAQKCEGGGPAIALK